MEIFPDVLSYYTSIIENLLIFFKKLLYILNGAIFWWISAAFGVEDITAVYS